MTGFTKEVHSKVWLKRLLFKERLQDYTVNYTKPDKWGKMKIFGFVCPARALLFKLPLF